MYKIALVQNQSEMYHYWYADSRNYISSRQYGFELFNAHNIGSLAAQLKNGVFQCVIFATSAFNDKVIYQTVETKEFVDAFAAFMRAGNGCLVLSQIKVAQNNLPISFLKGCYDLNINDNDAPPSLVYRDKKESVFERRNFSYSSAKKHLLTFYPNEIDINKVHDNCLKHGGRNGTYWYHWGNLRHDLWETLIEDENRPLVVCSNENFKYRIVLSSLLLDWQENHELLDNIICWLVEKRHSTAILAKNEAMNEGFSYFMRSLEAERYPHKVYDISESDLLASRIEQGVHAVVIIHPLINYSALNDKLKSVIKNKTDSGKIKYIEFVNTDEIDSFLVSGKNKTSTRLFRELEPAINAEMLNGYIDGSFWSTIETLQALCEIEKMNEVGQINIKLDKSSLKTIFELARKREKQGSYDDVVGTTEALLWLKTRFLEGGSARTEATLKWLLNYPNMDARDQLTVYTTIVELGLDNGETEDKLRKLLYRLNVNSLDGIRLGHLLKTLCVLRDPYIISQMLEPVVNALKACQEQGCWVDLDATALIAINLIKLYELISNKGFNPTNPLLKMFDSVCADINAMIYDAVIFIQRQRRVVDGKDIRYPFGNKIHTSIKCVLAWMMFDRAIEIPVEEIKRLLNSYQDDAHAHVESESSVRTVERMLNENLVLKKEVERAKRKDPKSTKNIILRAGLNMLSMLCIYATFMFLAILVYLTVAKDGQGTVAEFWNILWKFWSLHSTLVIAPVLAIYKSIKELKLKEALKKEMERSGGNN